MASDKLSTVSGRIILRLSPSDCARGPLVVAVRVKRNGDGDDHHGHFVRPFSPVLCLSHRATVPDKEKVAVLRASAYPVEVVAVPPTTQPQESSCALGHTLHSLTGLILALCSAVTPSPRSVQFGRTFGLARKVPSPILGRLQLRAFCLASFASSSRIVAETDCHQATVIWTSVRV